MKMMAKKINKETKGQPKDSNQYPSISKASTWSTDLCSIDICKNVNQNSMNKSTFELFNKFAEIRELST